MKIWLGSLCFMLLPLSASAAAYWTGGLTDWNVYLDNGVVYIGAANMPAHCAFARAQIDTSTQVYTATYQRDLYAYVMAAYTAGKPLKIVLNDQETTCKVYGANDRP
jgi:hypothetical protein